MADISARLITQKRFEYQSLFPARFCKHDEDDQILGETE